MKLLNSSHQKIVIKYEYNPACAQIQINIIRVLLAPSVQLLPVYYVICFKLIFGILKDKTDMENVTLSPSAVSKLKTRTSVKKIKHGSPKLQEVLRERCRERMRERRGQLFNRARFGSEINSNIQDTLTEIVRKELNNLATTDLDPVCNPFSPIVNEPLSSEEALELETEILNEEAQWILDEYEKMSQNEIELLSMYADRQVDEVICPKCQTSILIQKENKISCVSCDFMLSNNVTVKEVGTLISNSVNNHSAKCTASPGFLPFTENDITSLYLVCDRCSTWTFII